MPAGICLMPQTADKFIQAVKDGKINPEKLANMTSAERNDYFGQIVGENHATAVNSLFESKLLLKNQKAGMVTWAKQVSGIKPAVRRDIIKKIEDLQGVLDPAEQKQFLHDLTATRLGVAVTDDEAKNIADLSKKVTELEALRKPDKTFPSEDDRLNYGRAVEDLTDYVSGLKQAADKVSLRSLVKQPGLVGKFTGRVAGNLKSIQASMDDSAIFRQGWKTLMAHPGIWQKNARQSFVNLAKQFGGKNVMREVNADIISRPTYDAMVKAKLAIKNPEEAFPEALAEKVPLLGRAYKASEAAYTAFIYKTRADVFDKYLQVAKSAGVDISDPDELKSIGAVVNSLTGRGGLGKAEPVGGLINNAFFSPRFVKSNIDVLTHPLGFDIAGTKVTAFARRQAAKNTLKLIGGTAVVLGLADATSPGSVEWDPRSSNFGKIKVGDTTFDVTGGMASILTLGARLATQSTKSATTGIVQKLDTGKFGAPTSLETAEDFLTGKASPIINTLIQLRTGQNTIGQKTSAKQTLEGSVTPIGAQNYEQLKSDPNSADKLVTMIADGLGISANDYAPKGSNGKSSWQQSTSKELAQFKQKEGQQKFIAAGKQFDTEYNKWLGARVKTPAYQKLSSDDKQKLVEKKQAVLKGSIFKAYGFKYKRQKSTVNKSLL